MTYKLKIGKAVRNRWGNFTSGQITSSGFISTSMDKATSESFAWFNEQSKHEATVFEIMFKSRYQYYVMDMSAFPEENEVLLYDGLKFEVISVQKTVGQQG